MAKRRLQRRARSVVDAVADHRHGFAGGFEFLHFGGFVARTHIAEGVSDTQLLGDVFDRAGCRRS